MNVKPSSQTSKHEIKTSLRINFIMLVQKSLPILMCLQEHSQNARLGLRHSNDSTGVFLLKLIKSKNRKEGLVSLEKIYLATHRKGKTRIIN